jgi:hypothetical protein
LTSPGGIASTDLQSVRSAVLSDDIGALCGTPTSLRTVDGGHIRVEMARELGEFGQFAEISGDRSLLTWLTKLCAALSQPIRFEMKTFVMPK